MGSQSPKDRIQQQAKTIAELRKKLGEYIEVANEQAALIVKQQAEIDRLRENA